MTLVRGEAIPLQSFGVILRHAEAVIVHDAELVLRLASPWSAARRYHFRASA